MVQYRGFTIPETFDIGYAIRTFNRGGACWCRSTDCTSVCAQCLLCSNFGNGHTKRLMFAAWCTEHDIEVDISEYNTAIVNAVINGTACVCGFCNNITAQAATYRGRNVCPACMEHIENGRIISCDACGDLLAAYNAVRITSNPEARFCASCASAATRCIHCGGLFLDVDDATDNWICNECRHLYSRCTDCGSYFRPDDPDEVLCCDCAEDDGFVRRYHYKPVPVFNPPKTSASAVYMGVELEAGGASECDRDCCAEALSYSTSPFYLKRDSSIPEYGFELVTHPCSLEYHTNSFGWGKVLNAMRNHNLRSHSIDNCGLHIHVNRDALNSRQWIIVDWFIAKFSDKWTAIARRSPNRYCHQKELDGRKLKTVCGRSTDRYAAVNFTNRNTVEFRLFRGSLIPETVLGTIAAVDGLINWARTVKCHDIIAKGAWEAYMTYLSSDSKWSDAVAYINSRVR